jgi:hypothetical protein
MSTYDLIDVIVSGGEVQARPIAWDGEDVDGQGHDAQGRQLLATRYHTTCPKCGQLVEFETDNIAWVPASGNSPASGHVNCVFCGPEVVKANPTPLPPAPPATPVLIEKPIQPGPIIDPIVAGLFSLDLLDIQFIQKCENSSSVVG